MWSIYKESLLFFFFFFFVRHRKLKVCHSYLRSPAKGKKISHVELIINTHTSYTFIVSCTLANFSHTCSFFFSLTFALVLILALYGFLQCNRWQTWKITKKRKKKKGKNQTENQKKWELCVCPPSLAVTAQRTLSAWWWDIIKEEEVEALCLQSSPSGSGSPVPRPKAWSPHSPWPRSRRSLAARPRQRRSSPRALAWTAAAPARTGSDRHARSPEPDAPPRTSSARSTCRAEEKEANFIGSEMHHMIWRAPKKLGACQQPTIFSTYLTARGRPLPFSVQAIYITFAAHNLL